MPPPEFVFLFVFVFVFLFTNPTHWLSTVHVEWVMISPLESQLGCVWLNHLCTFQMARYRCDQEKAKDMIRPLEGSINNFNSTRPLCSTSWPRRWSRSWAAPRASWLTATLARWPRARSLRRPLPLASTSSTLRSLTRPWPSGCWRGQRPPAAPTTTWRRSRRGLSPSTSTLSLSLLPTKQSAQWWEPISFLYLGLW